ncbi:MAG: NADH-quinone oxidoreductase subunit H [Lachnospiraceae bacterium]|nr:NADH-quinone oxidoreductase subunit H [Lachnospiraceae bacterium]
MTEYSMISVIIYLIFAPFIVSILSGVDRIVTARMQGRCGPRLLQPWFDLIKLFSKESTAVNGIQKILVMAHCFFAIFSGAIFFAGGDILLVLFALTMAEVFLILGAYSVNAAYSEIGAQRELLQMMAYEPMTLLTAAGFYLSAGSFRVTDIISGNIPLILKMPGFFIGFCFVLVVKLRKSPFDLATSHHANQEIIKGLTGDLSGPVYGFSLLAELYEEALMLGMAGLFFLTSDRMSIIAVFIAIAVIMFVMSLIDNIFPRVKWETLLKTEWIVTFFAGGGNLIILSLIRK